MHMTDWTNRESNPHSLQAVDIETGFEFTRSLSPDYPRRPYRRRAGELKTVIHWGKVISLLFWLVQCGNVDGQIFPLLCDWL